MARSRRSRRLGASLGSSAAALLLSSILVSRASFAFPTSRLTYARGAGAESCPDEAAVRQAVATRLGYDPFFPSAEKTIVARIVRSKDELRATVELVDGRGLMRGVRELKAAPGQCGELVATMALAISIAIDPTNPAILGAPPATNPATTERGAAAGASPAAERASGSTDGAGSPAKGAPAEKVVKAPGAKDSANAPRPAPSRADDAEQDDVPNPRLARLTELRPGASVLGLLGTAPGPTMGFALSAGVRRGAWSINLEGRGDFPASVATNGGEVRTSLWVGALGACVHFDPLFVCPTAWLGSLRAQGVGFTQSRTDRSLYAAAGARIGIEIVLSERFVFRPELDLQTTLLPVALQVDGATTWEAPRYAGLFGAGVIARFP